MAQQVKSCASLKRESVLWRLFRFGKPYWRYDINFVSPREISILISLLASFASCDLTSNDVAQTMVPTTFDAVPQSSSKILQQPYRVNTGSHEVPTGIPGMAIYEDRHCDGSRLAYIQ